MKTFLVTMFIWLSLPPRANSQVDSLKGLLQFYPIQKGNFWEYQVEEYDEGAPGPPIEHVSTYSVEVIGDTLLSNGFRYSIMAYDSSFYVYEREDSATGRVFRYDSASSTNQERQIDSLFAAPYDTFFTVAKDPYLKLGSYRACYIYDTTHLIFGVPNHVKEFTEFPLVVDADGEFSYSLAEGIGLYSFHEAWYGGYRNTQLVYAKIDGKEYGKMVDLHLDSLLSYYPLHTGDYWEYKSVSEFSNRTCYDTSAFSIRITGDTLLPNGLNYKIMIHKNLYPNHDSIDFFERVDTLNGCVFRYDTESTDSEYQIDSVFARTGDSFFTASHFPDDALSRSRAVCQTITDTTVFYATTQIKDISQGVAAYSLAEGIGLCGTTVSWDDGITRTLLVYAEINHVGYGTRILLSVMERAHTPISFALYQNYPNPFNPTTVIDYSVPKNSFVTLKVYSVLGQEVTTLFSGMRIPGQYQATFHASRFASGVYFYRLQAGSYSVTKKMLLLK